MILRFDDICINTNIAHANTLAAMWIEKIQGPVWYCVSPLVEIGEGERVFPKIYGAMSDYQVFYGPDACGIPDIPQCITVCSHGLVHVDHRLLCRGTQELSIMVSCSLLKSRVFVPPFNKWNSDTMDICRENDIHLVCFEDGWRSLEFEKYTAGIDNYYLHSRDVSVSQLGTWIEHANNVR